MTQVAWVRIPLLSDFLLQLLPGLSPDQETNLQNPFQRNGKVAEWSKAYDSSAKNQIRACPRTTRVSSYDENRVGSNPTLVSSFCLSSSFLFFFCRSLDR
ncbi:hypothetical protein BDV41DRAFT_547024 [Aspergillus transmontanensis]|uniref:Secreted protein n=1 Tax=Aspergillus transmontanensis TaxID=1034304 RepID=A0A5N6VMB4_9EURO|nr:hypothetical protein BDV41DRAFT_547024 [Aspergillus transmontanensis]